MKNYFSIKLRDVRVNKNITQETLAGIIGVQPQTVSKWERGETYPDIETLPTIANYFKISIDELLGNDILGERKDIEDNFLSFQNKLDDNEWFDLCLKYHRRYPRDPQISTLFLQQLCTNSRDKLPEYTYLAYETCDQLLAECTDFSYRREAVYSICLICLDEEVDRWLDKLSKDWDTERLDVWAQRSRCLADKKNEKIYRCAANFYESVKMTSRLYEDLNYKNMPNQAVEWYLNYLKMLDGLSGVSDFNKIPDGWLGEYEYAYYQISVGYFECGEQENGYEALEKAFALYQRWLWIPDDAPLALGNPLVYGETKIAKGRPFIILPNGKQIPFNYEGFYTMKSLSDILDSNNGKKWFDSIKNNNRFLKMIESVR